MAKNNNLTDFLTDVADAIRDKKGTTEKINPQDFSDEIRGIKTSTSMWTGHVDVEGLKAIGWDDDDIAYFQEHGVNWMAEDDEYYKVSDDNKDLYGVINYSNYKDYKDIIVYLPKFDMSNVEGYKLFEDFTKIVGMPLININPTNLYFAFNCCHSLTCIPPLDCSEVTNMNSAFRGCFNLLYIPPLDTSKVTNFLWCFGNCVSLEEVYDLSFDSATIIDYMFPNSGIKRLPIIDCMGLTEINIVHYCYNLRECKIKRLKNNLLINWSYAISKESILYIINNEVATEAITITLYASAYARLATDPDIVAALNNHPLVSLASA